eukprot:COSAG04_NODE_303_length_17328_cov_9.758937_14_plen_157_part_00
MEPSLPKAMVYSSSPSESVTASVTFTAPPCAVTAHPSQSNVAEVDDTPLTAVEAHLAVADVRPMVPVPVLTKAALHTGPELPGSMTLAPVGVFISVSCPSPCCAPPPSVALSFESLSVTAGAGATEAARQPSRKKAAAAAIAASSRQSPFVRGTGG